MQTGAFQSVADKFNLLEFYKRLSFERSEYWKMVRLGVSAAKGMSGGPVFTLGSNGIEVLGVVARGDDLNSYMCSYFNE